MQKKEGKGTSIATQRRNKCYSTTKALGLLSTFCQYFEIWTTQFFFHDGSDFKDDYFVFVPVNLDGRIDCFFLIRKWAPQIHLFNNGIYVHGILLHFDVKKNWDLPQPGIWQECMLRLMFGGTGPNLSASWQFGQSQVLLPV